MKKFYTKLLVIAILLITIPFANSYARKFVVTVQNYSFTPDAIADVAVGDTISWVWSSGVGHTSTSATIPAGAASWDSPISSANPTFEYKVTIAGVYNYVCTLHAALGMTGSFTASTVTGIADNTAIFGNFLLSPNPASESVRVSFSPSNPFKGSVKLIDLLGNNLWKSEAAFVAGLNLTEINLAYIPKGVYFVALSDSKNNMVVKRLIIR